MTHPGKYRAAERTWRRESAGSGYERVYVPRLFSPRLVTTFLRILVVVFALTILDVVASFATLHKHDLATWIARISP
jgi:hypothetical protein